MTNNFISLIVAGGHRSRAAEHATRAAALQPARAAMALAVGNGSPAHYSVLIIGAGQAGLSVSWHLTHTGIPHAVLDRSGPLNGTQTSACASVRLLGATHSFRCGIAIFSRELYIFSRCNRRLASSLDFRHTASTGTHLTCTVGAYACISMAQRSMGFVLSGHSELDGPAPREALHRS